MDTYYTIEEKYLKAVQKVEYGRTRKALLLLKEIVENDPLYARAHYQLGKIYYRELKDYRTAGYHLKCCVDIEPEFPDAYFDYLSLVVFLNMEKLVHQVSEKALKVPGVFKADIYNQLGLFYEKNKAFDKALGTYKLAFMEATQKHVADEIIESIERLSVKIRQSGTFQYELTG